LLVKKITEDFNEKRKVTTVYMRACMRKTTLIKMRVRIAKNTLELAVEVLDHL